MMLKSRFDVVIGNPPYAGFHGLTKEYKETLKHHYDCAAGRFDYYMPFIEMGLRLILRERCLVYICPSTFLKRDGGSALRQLIRHGYGIRRIVDFGDQRIFADALNYTGIYFFSSSQPESVLVQAGRYLQHETLRLSDGSFRSDDLPGDGSMWFLPTGPAYRVWQTTRAGHFVKLGSVATISEGIVTGCNEVFLMKRAKASELGIESDILYPCSRGSEVHPYVLDDPDDYLIYPYEPTTGRVIAENVMKQQYPNAYRYLKSQRARLSGRDYFDQSGKECYELWNERNIDNLMCDKIVVSELGDRNSFALSRRGILYGDTVCGIVLRDAEISPRGLVPILNSVFMNYYFRQLSVPKANNFIIFKPLYLREIPLPRAVSDRDARVLEEATQELSDRQLSQTRRSNLQRDVDRIVFGMYSLLPDEVLAIGGTA